MFNLFSYKSKKELIIAIEENQFVKEFYNEIENKLTNSYITNISKTKNSLEFTAPIFRFAWNGWNMFNGISKGKFNVSFEDGVPYLSKKIYFFEFFIISLLFTIIPIASFDLLNFAIAIFIVIWAVYAISCFVSIYRTSNFIGETILKVNYRPRFGIETEYKIAK